MKNKKSGFAFAPLLIIIAALAAIGIGGYYVGQSQKAAPQLAISNEIGGAGLSLEQIKNGTVSLEDFSRVKLKSGHYEEMIFMGKDNGPLNSKITLDLGKVASGDLNGDGQADAAAFMVERTGGTGSFGHLVVFLNQGGQPVQIPGVIGLGDREPVQNLTIESGVITVVLLTHDSGEPACCAATPRTDRYQLVGNSLVKLAPANEMADWKTYQNDKYGFEFRYPSNLVGQISENNGMTLAGPCVVGGRYDSEENLNTNRNTDNDTSGYFSFCVLDGVKAGQPQPNSIYGKVMKLNKPGQYFVFDSTISQQYSDKILSTFKFTK